MYFKKIFDDVIGLTRFFLTSLLELQDFYGGVKIEFSKFKMQVFHCQWFARCAIRNAIFSTRKSSGLNNLTIFMRNKNT